MFYPFFTCVSPRAAKHMERNTFPPGQDQKYDAKPGQLHSASGSIPVGPCFESLLWPSMAFESRKGNVEDIASLRFLLILCMV
jgi:hypothetical protein